MKVFLFVVWQEESLMKAQVVYQYINVSFTEYIFFFKELPLAGIGFRKDNDQFFSKVCIYHLLRVFTTKPFHGKLHDFIKCSNKAIDAIFTVVAVSQKNLFIDPYESFRWFSLRYTKTTSKTRKQNNRPHHCSTFFWAFFKSRNLQKHYIFCTSASKVRFGHDFCRKYMLVWAGKKL